MQAVRIVLETSCQRAVASRRRSLERELEPAPSARRKGPCINIFESIDSFKIVVAAAGVAASDYDLQIAEDRVVIICQREAQPEDEEEFRRMERWQGKHRREIRLRSKVQPEAVQAESLNGILTILLPKWQSKPLRRVAVNDGSRPRAQVGEAMS